jgi:uncharacterized protein
MSCKWDPNKAKTNISDHGVDFADAEGVFEDEYGLSQEDPTAQGEHRYITIGMDFLGRLVVVGYTYRGECIRLIWARKATRKERKTYERRRPGS